MSMKFGKVSKTKDLNEYDDVRIVGKTFPDHEAEDLSLTTKPPSSPRRGTADTQTMRGESGQILWQEKCTWWV